MRASSQTSALLSLFAACALGTFAQGCSLGVEPLVEEERIVELPPLLELETPRAGLVYSAADDERPDAPGLDLLFRVRVNDLENGVWLEDIALGTEDGELVYAPVHEDWRGLRCAEIPLRVFPGDETTTVTVVASAGDGLARLEERIRIGADAER